MRWGWYMIPYDSGERVYRKMHFYWVETFALCGFEPGELFNRSAEFDVGRACKRCIASLRSVAARRPE